MHSDDEFATSSDDSSVYDGIEATTGASVLGIRFDRGVIIAADTMVSFGPEKSTEDAHRVFKINENAVFGGSGDFPDIGVVSAQFDAITAEDYCFQVPQRSHPEMLASWLSNDLYSRHEAERPLYCDLVLGGIEEDGTPYLASVSRFGGLKSHYVVGTEMAFDMAVPMVEFRKPEAREFTANEASDLVQTCMTALYYRYTRSFNKYMVGWCTNKECNVYGPVSVKENWSHAPSSIGY